MALIGGSFDMGRAQTNSRYAYEAWLDYQDNNSLCISEEEFQALTTQYNDVLHIWKQWKEEADTNDYDIEDEEFYDSAWQGGVNEAETDANYDGENGCADTVINNVLGVGANAATTAFVNISNITVNAGAGISGGTVLSKTGSKIFNKTLEKAGGAEAGKAATDQATKAVEKSGGSWMVTAPLTFAIATLYTITQPNSEAHKALMQLKTIMDQDIPQELNAAIAELSVLEANVLKARENAEAIGLKFDENAEGIEGEIAKYEIDKANKEAELAEAQLKLQQIQILYNAANETITSIQARIDGDEEVTPSEMSQLEAAKANLSIRQGEISALQATIDTLTRDIEAYNLKLLQLTVQYTEEKADGVDRTAEEQALIEGEQAAYDEQGAAIASKQGYLDEAASYDEATKTMCIVESVSQGANMVSAIYAGVKAGIAVAASLGTNVYAWACTAMATAAAVMSGVGMGQQIKWAVDIGKEIDSRENAQNSINTSLGEYENHIETWNTLNDNAVVINHGIENYELDAPDLSRVPEKEEE